MPVEVIGVDHVSVTVRDMDAAKEFYDRVMPADHDPYAPGLHHLCFRVVDEEAVDRAAREPREVGVEATRPRYYTEYGPDYYATSFEDPDGVRLEVMNFRELRRKIMHDWQARAGT